jgi:putative lipoic acid-binding regulatory protein
LKNDTPSEYFYLKFSEQLAESQAWPGIYMFKFVVKSESSHLETLKALFDSDKADFSEKLSSKKTFTSLTIKIRMDSPAQVISIYKKSSTLEGVMAL